MADPIDEKDDKEEKPLAIVEDADLEKRGEASDPDDDHDEDDDDAGDDTTASGGDKRAGHAEGAVEGEDAEQTSNRQKRQDRKQRQREARERAERELNFLRNRNEQLERRQSAIEARQMRTDKNAIDNRLTSLKGHLEDAKEAKAAAIEAQAGADVVEADEVIREIEGQIERLSVAKQRIEQPPARETQQQMPPGARKAVAWIKRNEAWYKPDGSDEPSAITQSIETTMTREGYDPRDDDYWVELDRRLQRRIPEVFGKKPPRREEREDDDPPLRRERQQEQPARRNGSGPKVSVGGQSRHLKPGEVYVSPDRKEAMIEAGVWDDLVLRQKHLAAYQRYDREHGLI